MATSGQTRRHGVWGKLPACLFSWGGMVGRLEGDVAVTAVLGKLAGSLPHRGALGEYQSKMWATLSRKPDR